MLAAGRPCIVSNTCVVSRPGIAFSPDLSLSVERQFDYAIGRERVGVDLDVLIGARCNNQVTRAVLCFKRDFRDLWEASQHALPHLMNKVLNRLADELMEGPLQQVAHL